MEKTIIAVFDTIAKAKETRYKVFKGYKIDRWIIKTFMGLTFLFLLFVAWHYNFNLDYYKCEGSQKGNTIIDGCKNPFYSETNEWKGQEYLAPGEYGFKPTTLFNSVYYMPFVLIGLALVLNHLIHNKKFKFSEVEDDNPRDKI